MRHKIIIFILGLAAMVCSQEVMAQHTLGFTMGYGMSNGRLQPEKEMKALWGSYTGGLSWRYYTAQRFVGGFGIDLEFLQQGFSFAQNTAQVEDPSEYIYYTRKVNSLVMPIVWQPHFYLLHHRIRVYFEAAATFSYNLSSTYENGMAQTKGDYEFKLARDNRWGYGLAGGAGISVLIKQFEINVRARYYFGYSDIVRNRNKYADNTMDGPENPFYATPLRSPLDNMTISVGMSYRFNKEGFKSWKPRQKKAKNKEVFKFGL